MIGLYALSISFSGYTYATMFRLKIPRGGHQFPVDESFPPNQRPPDRLLLPGEHPEIYEDPGKGRGIPMNPSFFALMLLSLFIFLTILGIPIGFSLGIAGIAVCC